MRLVKCVMMILSLAVVAGCGSKFKTYNGPEVTRVLVYKEESKMYLLHHDEVLTTYKVELGFSAEGHKQFEGDGKTPEGEYRIDRRNPNSAFHLSIGISYPNVQDIERARAAGKKPGMDIFIHGRPNLKKRGLGPDWTAGCIAVKDREMEDIYAMVRD